MLRVALLRSALPGWGITADIPRLWPLSLIDVEVANVPLCVRAVLAAVTLAGLAVAIRLATGRFRTSLSFAAAVGLASMLITNLFHGVQYGLAFPHAGELQYYADAVRIDSVAEFVRGYTAAQEACIGLDDFSGPLSCHSRTHPPGPVLFIHGLEQLTGSPAGTSVLMAIVTVLLLATSFRALASNWFRRDVVVFGVLLLFLLPGMQIYGCATIDSIIAGTFLWTVAAFLQNLRSPAAVGSQSPFWLAALFLWLSSALTFAAVFLAPLLLGLEWRARRSCVRTAGLLADGDRRVGSGAHVRRVLVLRFVRDRRRPGRIPPASGSSCRRSAT